jgi:hypothetical protein
MVIYKYKFWGRLVKFSHVFCILYQEKSGNLGTEKRKFSSDVRLRNIGVIKYTLGR